MFLKLRQVVCVLPTEMAIENTKHAVDTFTDDVMQFGSVHCVVDDSTYLYALCLKPD